MEKIQKPLKAKYLPLCLYFDELSALVNLLKDAEIISDGYKFSNLQELKDHFGKNRPKSLEISTFNPYLSIELSDIDARIWATSASKENIASFYQIDEILRKHVRKPKFAYSFIFSLFLVMLIWGLNFLSKFFQNPILLTGHLASLTVAFLWVCWSGYIRLKSHSTIKLIRRTEKENFFKRNFDQIVINLLVALMSFSLGFATKYLDQHYFSKDIKQNEITK